MFVGLLICIYAVTYFTKSQIMYDFTWVGALLEKHWQEGQDVPLSNSSNFYCLISISVTKNACLLIWNLNENNCFLALQFLQWSNFKFWLQNDNIRKQLHSQRYLIPQWLLISASLERLKEVLLWKYRIGHLSLSVCVFSFSPNKVCQPTQPLVVVDFVCWLFTWHESSTFFVFSSHVCNFFFLTRKRNSSQHFSLFLHYCILA